MKTQPRKSQKKSLAQLLFFILLAIVLLLGSLNIAKAKGYLLPSQPEPLVVDGKVNLDVLTLDQKIAQMVVVTYVPDVMPVWKNLQMGGIYLYSLGSESYFREVIERIQNNMTIPFLITADAEGCFSPFQNFWHFAYNSEIHTIGEAFEKGYREGGLMRELGFNLNFAPVVDLEDQIWKCRSFPGNSTEISELAYSYVLGLQSQGIMATAKHYPGKTLVGRDPHESLASAEIEQVDLDPYEFLINKGGVNSIMVSHIITTGEVYSEDVPSDVSQAVIYDLKRRYPGLIISDEIHMLGLRNFYDSLDELYLAVFKAGNDIVLNFDKDPNEIYHMIQVIKGAVENGDISEEEIDNSVTKILEAKGFEVMSD